MSEAKRPEITAAMAREALESSDVMSAAAHALLSDYIEQSSAEASAQGEAGRLNESEVASLLTEAMRAADQAFERIGGSTRHHVRECLVPELERMGLTVVRAKSVPLGWFSPHERKPALGVTVAVLRRDEAEPIAARLDDDGDWIDAATHEIRNVTHWASLPPPPKAEP